LAAGSQLTAAPVASIEQGDRYGTLRDDNADRRLPSNSMAARVSQPPLP
jgi:hypothetical protein